jgi:hypothetical protein
MDTCDSPRLDCVTTSGRATTNPFSPLSGGSELGADARNARAVWLPNRGTLDRVIQPGVDLLCASDLGDLAPASTVSGSGGRTESYLDKGSH